MNIIPTADQLNALRLMTESIDPATYIGRISNQPYEWQRDAMDPTKLRVILNCARQSGKSTDVSGIGTHSAKHVPESLNIIVSPSEQQSIETMKKCEDYIARDPELLNSLTKDSATEKEFANRSRIISLPGTERAVRGYSGPTVVIIDEASKVPDETYKAIRPMLTGNPRAKLILLSTPWNASGFFYEEWAHNARWHKILVVPKWEYDDNTGLLIPRGPEEEFRKMWAEKGVNAYYSPRHELEWLYEELESLGPIWFKREYGCEFVEGAESFFGDALIKGMYSDEIEKVYDQNLGQYESNIKIVKHFDGLWGN